MATIEILLPKMGESVAEATITKFITQPGERAEADEPLVEIATDKVDSEVPAPEDGTLVEWLVAEGDTVAVGQAIARFDVETEGANAGAPAAAPAATPAEAEAPTPTPTPTRQPQLQLQSVTRLPFQKIISWKHCNRLWQSCPLGWGRQEGFIRPWFAALRSPKESLQQNWSQFLARAQREELPRRIYSIM